MTIISWNVNGIRAAIKKGFLDFFNKSKPHIFCLQEIKALAEQVELELPPGFKQYWNSAEKKGYSGTAIFSKMEPQDVVCGIGVKEGDTEGRVITLEFSDFYLVNVYTPNAKNDLSRLKFREKIWDPAFLKYLKKLEKKKPVVFCGDLNVAHQEIDLANPQSNRHNAGFTDEERSGFNNIVNAGFLDTFREFEPGPNHYTWWSYRTNARARNIGWRIDYFGISPLLRPRLKKAFIQPEIMGSDHCPVGIVLK